MAATEVKEQGTFGYLERYGRTNPIAKRHDLPYHVIGSEISAAQAVAADGSRRTAIAPDATVLPLPFRSGDELLAVTQREGLSIAGVYQKFGRGETASDRRLGQVAWRKRDGLLEHVGGDAGWPYANVLWRVRGLMDRAVESEVRAEIEQTLDRLPKGRTPTQADWRRISQSMRDEIDGKIARVVAVAPAGALPARMPAPVADAIAAGAADSIMPSRSSMPNAGMCAAQPGASSERRLTTPRGRSPGARRAWRTRRPRHRRVRPKRGQSALPG